MLQPEHEDEEADLLVYFNDIAAHDFFDLVEASVDVVSGFPGVRSARHEDRELIVVHGRADPVPLQEELLRWWEAQLEALVEGRNR